MAVNTGIYDPSYKVGQALAYRPYFKYLKEREEAAASKASGMKLGAASATLYGKLNKQLMERKFLEQVTPTIPAQPEKTTYSGATITKGGTQSGGVTKTVTPAVVAQPGGDAAYKYTTGSGLVASPASFELTKAGKLAGMDPPKGKEITNLFGKKVGDQTGPFGMSKSMGSLMGAYQVGSGGATLFDPKASTARKVAGGVNVALGTNALLATIAGTQAWNPVGWGAMAIGAGATLADMFG